jgi:hypothetical protein
MEKKVKTYTWAYQVNCNAGATFGARAVIPNANNNMLLKSVTFEWKAQINSTLQQITSHSRRYQDLFFSIFGTPPLQIVGNFVNPAVGATVQNADSIIFFNTGHWEFEGFYLTNEINIGVSTVNTDTLNQILIYQSVIVQIQEL